MKDKGRLSPFWYNVAMIFWVIVAFGFGFFLGGPILAGIFAFVILVLGIQLGY